jgi:hypothetical protein
MLFPLSLPHTSLFFRTSDRTLAAHMQCEDVMEEISAEVFAIRGCREKV